MALSLFPTSFEARLDLIGGSESEGARLSFSMDEFRRHIYQFLPARRKNHWDTNEAISIPVRSSTDHITLCMTLDRINDSICYLGAGIWWYFVQQNNLKPGSKLSLIYRNDAHELVITKI